MCFGVQMFNENDVAIIMVQLEVKIKWFQHKKGFNIKFMKRKKKQIYFSDKNIYPHIKFKLKTWIFIKTPLKLGENLVHKYTEE